MLLIFGLMVLFCLNHEGVLIGGSSAQSDEMNLGRQAVSILQNHCLQCHGQDRMSDLDLRTRESMLKGGARGPAIKPGDGLSSLLYRFVSGEASPRMPLGEKLEDGKIDILKDGSMQALSGLKDYPLKTPRRETRRRHGASPMSSEITGLFVRS
ncbi:MAG: hypothetical protein IPJ07_01410 [Acidobacteria bacterium]|nr:hypothetical protein [Acidobacteriota bacterium]